MTNPFQNLSGNWYSSLVAGAMPAPQSPNALNTQIVNGLMQSYTPVQPPQYTNTDLIAALGMIANDYNACALYSGNNCLNPAQTLLAYQLLDGVTKVSYELIPAFIGYIEQTVGNSSLTPSQMEPIFMATMAGAKAYSYWNTLLQTMPIASPWTNWFAPQPGPSPSAINMAALPMLVQAAMEGVFVGYMDFMHMNTPAAHDKMIVMMLAGSACINNGKLIFNWLPNHPPINGIDPDTASNLAYAYLKGQKTGNPAPK